MASARKLSRHVCRAQITHEHQNHGERKRSTLGIQLFQHESTCGTCGALPTLWRVRLAAAAAVPADVPCCCCCSRQMQDDVQSVFTALSGLSLCRRLSLPTSHFLPLHLRLNILASATQFPSRASSAALLAARQTLRLPVALRMLVPSSIRIHHVLHHTSVSSYNEFLLSSSRFSPTFHFAFIFSLLPSALPCTSSLPPSCCLFFFLCVCLLSSEKRFSATERFPNQISVGPFFHAFHVTSIVALSCCVWLLCICIFASQPTRLFNYIFHFCP